ncbi:MAG: hypothetical protein U0992_02210 [Planctomycetaceae bacterium]
MKTRLFENRATWLVAGVLFGFAVATYWPSESAHAEAVDHINKIALVSAKTGLGSSDAIWVLDTVTGRLIGAAYNTQIAAFNQKWYRNVAADFNVKGNAQYAIVPASVVIPISGGGSSPAEGGLYIAELTTGKVALYGYGYNQTPSPLPAMEAVLVDYFEFRAVQE